MNVAVDTNVILRYLLDDDPEQAAVARQVISEAASVAIPLPVLCEVVWTLARGYKLARADIAHAVTVLVKADKVRVDRSAVEAGLAILRAGGDFADGVIAHQGRLLGADTFVTFDKKAASLMREQTSIATRLLS